MRFAVAIRGARRICYAIHEQVWSHIDERRGRLVIEGGDAGLVAEVKEELELIDEQRAEYRQMMERLREQSRERREEDEAEVGEREAELLVEEVMEKIRNGEEVDEDLEVAAALLYREMLAKKSGEGRRGRER
jgi:transcription initiation factor TFIIIB Brf1 subunit/transcription initiation factor TFIIB